MSASTTEALQARLREGAAAMGLELSAPQLAQLMEFLALLQKWNKVYNLTAVRNPEEMLTHHLLDSLAAVAPLQRHLAEQGGAGQRLLDVGGVEQVDINLVWEPPWGPHAMSAQAKEHFGVQD